MSGLEVLGALAGASQLIEQSIKIISLISKICAAVRDAPESIRKLEVQLNQLLHITKVIKDNASLKSDNITAVLLSCQQEANVLLDTLDELLVAAGDGKAKKLWKSVVGVRKETKILGHLEALERHKTSLALAIHTIDSALLSTVQFDLDKVKTSINESSFDIRDTRKNVTTIVGTLPEIRDGISDIQTNIVRNVTAIHDMQQAMQQLSMNEQASKPPPEPEPHTKKYYSVPNHRVRGFIGREDILKEIEDGFSSGPAPRTVVLRGMGGQGKTQIALEHCHRAKDNPFSTIFWVDATSRGSLEKSFEVISEEMSPSNVALTSTDSRVKFVMTSLSVWPSPWLMVFDNHDDPDAFGNLQDFMPDSEHGSILITTRHAGVDALGKDRRAIEIPGLPEKDALDLLFRQSLTKVLDPDITHGKNIVERLGYHPLAITQAAAYINRRKIPLKDFMGHYNRRRKIILEHTPQISQYRRRLNDSDKETSLNVFTTWELSFQQLETTQTQGGLKANLLTLFGFFNHKDISERIFEEFCLKKDPLDQLASCLDSLIDIFQESWDGDLFLDILSELRDLSLLQNFAPEADGFQHFSLHPLVKDWIRLRTDKKICQEYSLIATEMLAEVIESYWRNHQYDMSLVAKQEILSHVDVQMENYRDFLGIGMVASFKKMQLIEFANSQSSFERIYFNTGRFNEAEDINRRLIELREKVLGPEHPDTLTSMSNLAGVINHQGKYEEAEAMNRHVTELSEKVLRPEHPDTLTSMSNLASVLDSQGKYEEAEAMNRHVTELREKVLGPEHPDTLTSMNNLALVLDSQSKYEEAEAMNRHVTELYEKVLGPEHPDTLTSMSNLAMVLVSQGKYEEAEAMNRHVTELREKFLGPEHPDTLTSMSNLAGVINHQGKYEEAEAMNRHVTELSEKVLRPEHPDTLTSMSNLASVLDSQGKYEEAEAMNRHVTELREKVLGPEHPDTLTSMNNLALVLDSQSKYEEAEAMNRHVTELREKVLGPEHPDTLTSMSNLALVLKRQGKYEEAEGMSRCELQLSKKVLGPEHPDTLTSMSNLAGVFEGQGKYEEAEAMNRHVTELREKVLGPEHPDTLTSMNNLALVLDSQSKYEEAEAMNRHVTELYEKVLGPEHPDTLTSMSNLAMVLVSQGKYEEAEAMNRHVTELREKFLGPEHPHTLISMSNLALVLDSQGKYEEAEAMNRHVTELSEKVLGPEHPDTLMSFYCLAYCLHGQKYYESASAHYERALSGFKKTLGLDHPTTLKCSHDYSLMLEEMDVSSSRS
ncbi:MAG: hypothetical protein M1829_003379 [Trizodia sp. TS-e1964]|nr:MAG: hypothetical protein M1829_003379 [Trizodia sp. TS-e1964]